MTKEQAIEVLRRNTNLGYGIVIENESTQLIKEAIEMAIKALKQEPNEDCVSRQAVLNTLFYKSDNNCEVVLNKELQDIIKALPPVTPTQSWILIERRELTQEEKEFYSSLYGDEPEYMIESRMPDDGEEVLVSAGGIVFLDIFSHDEFDFEKISVDEIDAWMPLPQPYEDKRGNKDGSN